MQAPSPESRVPEVVRKLVGNWNLLSYVTENPDGSRGKPYGNAVGRLSYDELGNMAGQVMRPGRLDVAPGEWGAQQVRSAYAGYIAYFGTYEVNEAEIGRAHV